MEREKREVVTPVGKVKVILKAWLTGRERREIRSVLLEEVKFGQTSEGETTPEYNIQGSVLDKAQDKSFETVIISIGEKTDNIVDTVLDMRDEDFDFITKEIDKITASIDEESKKK